MSTAAAADAKSEVKSAPALVPVKSALDKREYRVIELPNALRAVLIHDPETDKAAAAMDVNVGHFCDPAEAPGLAHFLEHMLFLGTTKYPDENSYSSYLNSHGGHSNAYTGMENTNYYFDVTHEHLDGALDRFAQFFTSPLFTASATDREMSAVHNENAKNLQADGWRIFQLVKSTANPNHPFSKFGTGNLETLRDTPKKLGVNTRDELIKFHATYYSANRMKLAVIGRESLDKLEAIVKEKFSGIKNTNRAAPAFGKDAFHTESLQNYYHIVPVMELRELHIFWPGPSSKPHYNTKPASAMSHLLGHEGEGSILALLKKKGWANSLSAGLNQSTSSFSAMVVSMELTELGFTKLQEILTLVYQYVALMRAASEAEWAKHYAEQADVSAMNFRFKGTEQPSSYVSGLACSLGDYKPAEVLSGGWLYSNFDFKVIKEFVDTLTPANSRVHVIAQDFKGKTDKTEKWYGTAYAVKPFAAAEMKHWTDPANKTAELFLPKPNPFIATDFSLRPLPDAKDEKATAALKFPVLLSANDAKDAGVAAAAATGADAKADSKSAAATAQTAGASEVPNAVPGVRLFHKLDSVFRKPKANYIIDIVSPLAYSTPTTTLLTSLYCKLLEDSLQEFAYDAECAGLSYQLNNTTTGASLVFRGYNHKLPTLIKAILTRMRALVVDPTRFALIKEQVVRGIRNFDLEQPYSHGVYETGLFLDAKTWSHKERLAVIGSLTAEDVRDHIPRLLAAADIEMLAHGNVDRKEAIETAALIKQALGCNPLFASQVPDQRVVKLADNTRYLRRMADYNPADPNSCVVSLYQIGEDTPETNAVSGLLAHIASEPCFNQLRTIETLGYLVWSGVSTSKGVLSYRMIVQSSQHPADYLDGRTEAFLEQFSATLSSLSAEEYAKNLQAVISAKLEKDKTLNEETSRHWQEIAKHRYCFNRVDLEVEVLRRTTLADLVRFFNRYIRVNAPNRRKLTIHVFGNKHAYAAGLSTTPPPAVDAKAKAEPAAAAADGEEEDADGAAGAPAATTDGKPAAAAAAAGDKKPAEAKPLPPVPVDNATSVALDAYIPFKKAMPLFPNFV